MKMLNINASFVGSQQMETFEELEALLSHVMAEERFGKCSLLNSQHLWILQCCVHGRSL